MKAQLLFLFLVFVSLISCQSNQSDQEAQFPIIVTSDIEDGIKQHIKNESAQNDGFFKIDTNGGTLNLKLVRVHTEYLANLGPEEHFACVDLVDENGEVWDVDFFMKGKVGEMEVTSTSVHKLNGQPFYSWKKNKDGIWVKVPMEQSNNRLLGVIEGSDEFEFRYKVILPEINSEADIWIPVPQNDAWQTVSPLYQKSALQGKLLTDEYNGNTIQYYHFTPSNSKDTIEFTYLVTRKEKQAYPSVEEDVSKFLNPNTLIPADNKFITMADSILGEKITESDLIKARALYDYVTDNMRYIKAGKYGTGDALYACDVKTGNCSEFHSLFIALCRATNIPARFAIGAAIPSERNEGATDGYHCWAEFHADGKWWPVDISEANKYHALSTYYFGHHPANRLELTKGRDINVYPAPKSGPMNFLAFPHLEVDGEVVKANAQFLFTRES